VIEITGTNVAGDFVSGKNVIGYFELGVGGDIDRMVVAVAIAIVVADVFVFGNIAVSDFVLGVGFHSLWSMP